MNRTYDIQTQESTTIVTVVGDLDLSSSGMFAIVADLSTQPLERLIISLERCTYCDSSALTMLVRAHRMMQSGTVLVVLPEMSPCRRVFEITGLTKLLRVVPTLDSALSYKTIAA